MRRIHLSQGMTALVDDEDYEDISRFNWFVRHGDSTDYAVRAFQISTGRIQVSMHRHILQPKPCEQVDHRNHDGLDNRRSNLRVCSSAQNNQNKRLAKNNKTSLKGVCWNKEGGFWQANISVNGSQLRLGNFKHPFDAAVAYDEAAQKYFGEFALPNSAIGFPDRLPKEPFLATPQISDIEWLADILGVGDAFVCGMRL